MFRLRKANTGFFAALVLVTSLCALPAVAKDDVVSDSDQKSRLKVEKLKADALEQKQLPNAFASPYIVKAAELLQSRKTPEAIKILTEGTTKDPSNFELYRVRAMLHSNIGNYKAAISDSDKVISLSKNKRVIANAYLFKALTKRNSKQFPDYELDLKKAADADPNLVATQILYGEHLVKMGKGTQAIPYLSRAKNLLLNDASAEYMAKIDELLKKAKSTAKECSK